MSGQSKTSGIVGTSQYAPVEHHIAELQRYVAQGSHYASGDFLDAVLTNDLLRAVIHSDDPEHIHLVVKYVFNRMPSDCHGSKEKVRDWRKHRGAGGLEGQI